MLVVELWTPVLAALVLVLAWFCLRCPSSVLMKADGFPGPPTLPLLGNALTMALYSSDFYYIVSAWARQFYGLPMRMWICNHLCVLLTSPKDIEVILKSTKEIEKSSSYTFIRPWLGNSVLINTGEHWQRRRKTLTPAFHFKILEEFVDTFYVNGNILINILKDKVGGPGFNIHHILQNYGLDNIVETSLGIKINSQRSPDSEYHKAIKTQGQIVMDRLFKIWLRPDFLFKLSGNKKKQDEALRVLHGTTWQVIWRRREEMKKEDQQKQEEGKGEGEARRAPEGEDIGLRRRQNLIDILLRSDLTDEEIREEIDTFMFAGHDTTSTTLAYIAFALSWQQEIQEQVYKEIVTVWPNPDTPLTYNDLQNLKLLERVIKETMRLYTTIPLFGRQPIDDIVLEGGRVIPKEAEIGILVYILHRDPALYPDPDKFDPDRFLPENIQARHPYSYIPFSAGSRNCLGQKFAMLEMKCAMAQLVRQYRILPGCPSPHLKFYFCLTLNAQGGIPVRLEMR